MPEGMPEGMNLDPQVLVAVMNERLAAAAIREARLTAAVQQLTMENMKMNRALTKRDDLEVSAKEYAEKEEQDASTNG